MREDATAEKTAFDVVRAQVEAFNARDLDAFLATYSREAEVTGVAATPIAGAADLRAFYADRFGDAGVRCTIETYVLFGDRWVVARESIANSTGTTDTVAIFEVRDDVIVRAAMLKAEPVPHAA